MDEGQFMRTQGNEKLTNIIARGRTPTDGSRTREGGEEGEKLTGGTAAFRGAHAKY